MLKKIAFIAICLLFISTQSHAIEVGINDLVIGDGEIAQRDQIVVVHYTGWLMDGTKFDSSLDRKTPFKFTLGGRQVIQGWDRGIVGMKVGGKRQLVIPPQLAYGRAGAGKVIPPNATLKFEVELLEVLPPLFKNIDNKELSELQKEGVILVDVRTPKEWLETGVVEGSKLLPFRMPNGRINPRFSDDLAKIAGPKDKVVLICRTGNRTKMASQLMSERFGYEGIYNLRHGITYWMREKYPTSQPDMDSLKSTCSLC